MKHHDKTRKLGRTAGQRTALLRSLARSLVLHEKVQTTEAKAKELRPYVERLITLAKKDTVASRRLAAARLGGAPDAVKKLHEELAPRYTERAGGYTRITKLGQSGSDAASRAYIELV